MKFSVNKMIKQILCVLFLLQVTSLKGQLTDNQKCKASDSACIVQSAQKRLPYFVAGIPELGIETLDTLLVDKSRVDLSGLKLAIKDIRIKGLKKLVFENISFDMDKKVLKVSYHTNIDYRGKYKASGRLLILPITGDGDFTAKLKTMHVELIMPFDIAKNKNGQDVIKLKSWKFNFDIKDNVHFSLTNLFNGNKETSDALHKFMNENWKLLSVEFGRPLLHDPHQHVFKAIKAYLMSIPLENLFVQ